MGKSDLLASSRLAEDYRSKRLSRRKKDAQRMTYSIEQLKGEIGRGGGVAKNNLFRVLLPVIPEIYLNSTGVAVATPQSLNILCTRATLPGRQLMTVERTIGTVTQKVAYGYINDEVTFSFLGLNNYVVRKYLEDWQNYALNQNNFEVKYKTQYAKNVIIQQLDQSHRVVYAVKLEKAFPTQLLNIDFSNDNGQPVEVGVNLSYTRWSRVNFLSNAISTEAQELFENLLL